jgi:hypothetical protein
MTPFTLAPPFKDKEGTRKVGAERTDGQCHTERTPARRTKGGFSWPGALHPRQPTRTAPPIGPWQLQRLARMVGPLEPQVTETSPSPPTQHSHPAGQEILVHGGVAATGQLVTRSLSRAISAGARRRRSPLAG